MGRRLIGSLVVAAACAAVLALPASALAASTFSWTQPGDVTQTGGNYGVQSWAYADSSGSLNYLSSFKENGSALAGYTNGSNGSPDWIATPTGSGSHPLEMVPTQGGSVSLTWTSPFSGSQPVSISGSVSEPNQGLLSLCTGTTWTLTSGATTLASGSASGSLAQGAPVNVSPGGQLALTVSDAQVNLGYSTVCDQTDVNLTLTVPATPPSVTLTSPAAGATISATQPTFAGTASERFGDDPHVGVAVFSGTTTSGKPLETLTTTETAGGWSVQASPALSDGTYTAVAAQSGVGGLGLSSTVMFTISNVVPTGQLTLTEPASGASVSQTQLVFGGSAATASGDSSTVTISVWKGDSASGKPLGTTAVTESGGTWTATWPHKLALGLYTVEASQSTPTGTVSTPSHRFLIVPASGTVGNAVQMSRGRVVTVSITCLAPSGDMCTGSVLVFTAKSFQPTPGGPKGSVRLAFAYLSITSGQTLLIRHMVSRAVYRTLHHQKHLKVHVTTLLTEGGGTPLSATVTRTLAVK